MRCLSLIKKQKNITRNLETNHKNINVDIIIKAIELLTSPVPLALLVVSSLLLLPSSSSPLEVECRAVVPFALWASSVGWWWPSASAGSADANTVHGSFSEWQQCTATTACTAAYNQQRAERQQQKEYMRVGTNWKCEYACVSVFTVLCSPVYELE